MAATLIVSPRQMRLQCQSADLTAEVIYRDGSMVVRIEGAAGIFGLEQLEHAFVQVVARRPRFAVLDFSRLTFLSSLAMSLLVQLRRDAGRWNGRVKITGCPPVIRETLDVAGLADLFEFHPTVAEAMNTTLVKRDLQVTEPLTQPGLQFATEDLGQAVVIHVRGEAGCEQAAELEEQLRKSRNWGTQFVILNVAKLTNIGPNALAALADFARDVRRTGGEVWLAGVQPTVWLRIYAAKHDQLFTFRDSLAQALNS
ncbi:MAG TPA: STAS domain-containing protein [Gemmataceae bacterium]|nr:STAS domain-containing protein [Gemmataceae bacterium]